MKRKITEIDFNGDNTRKKLNDYVLAYFKANNLSLGDEWCNVEYMFWIDDKHTEFRKFKRLPQHITLNKDQEHEFLVFLGYEK